VPVDEQLATICATLRTAWAAAPDPSLQTGAEKARWLAAFTARSWEQRGRPCPERSSSSRSPSPMLAAPDVRAAARDRCRRLAALTGVGLRPIWEWGFMERVSTGLLALAAGWEQVGAEMLAVAAAICEPW
jgi:streptomycin 6-kinase